MAVLYCRLALTCVPQCGYTALVWAAASERTECVSLLLSAGAKLEPVIQVRHSGCALYLTQTLPTPLYLFLVNLATRPRALMSVNLPYLPMSLSCSAWERFLSSTKGGQSKYERLLKASYQGRR